MSSVSDGRSFPVQEYRRRKRKPHELLEKVCGFCDGPFSTRRKDRLYCSDTCRFRAWEQRKAGPPSLSLSTLIDALIEARASGDDTAIAAARQALDRWRP